jgi:hypothetical protein
MSSRRNGRAGCRACEESFYSAARGLQRDLIDRGLRNYWAEIVSFLHHKLHSGKTWYRKVLACTGSDARRHIT